MLCSIQQLSGHLAAFGKKKWKLVGSVGLHPLICSHILCACLSRDVLIAPVPHSLQARLDQDREADKLAAQNVQRIREMQAQVSGLRGIAHLSAFAFAGQSSDGQKSDPVLPLKNEG